MQHRNDHATTFSVPSLPSEATVIWLIAALAYIVGYLVTFRRIAGQLAWHFCAQARTRGYSWERGLGSPTGEHWLGAILQAFLYALVWPLSLPVAHGIAGSRSGTGLFYVPVKERERILAARIQELERAAGVK